MPMPRSPGWRVSICFGESSAGCRPRSSTPITRSRWMVFSSPARTGWHPAITGSRRSAPPSASWSSATPSRCGARPAFVREPGGVSTPLPSMTRTAERYWTYDKAGIDVRLWNVTTEIGIPVFVCDIRDPSPAEPRRLRCFHGAGCHPDRTIALIRALTEAAQTRLTYITGIRDDLLPAEYEEPPSAELVDALDRKSTRLNSSHPSISY